MFYDDAAPINFKTNIRKVVFHQLFLSLSLCFYSFCVRTLQLYQRVQGRIVLVVFLFNFCFFVATSFLVHNVEAIHGLC